jgi:hypothetical protein
MILMNMIRFAERKCLLYDGQDVLVNPFPGPLQAVMTVRRSIPGRYRVTAMDEEGMETLLFHATVDEERAVVLEFAINSQEVEA